MFKVGNKYRCNRNLYMQHSKEICFIKGHYYIVKYINPDGKIVLIDELNAQHGIGNPKDKNNWTLFFSNRKEKIKRLLE